MPRASNITCPKCKKDTAQVSESFEEDGHIVHVRCPCGYSADEVVA